jgi:hypothetical protein
MKAGRPCHSVVRLRRWVSALLFLSIFFLPLHIHVATAATAQLGKECSCVQGTRTQLASSTGGPVCVPQFPSTRLAISFTAVWLAYYSSPQDVRAPPVASL